MLREIKFRAWDEVEWKMYYNHSVCLTIDGEVTFLNTCGEWEKDDDKSLITLMQYTGLKDKNGKEIYDSDKVKRRVHLVEGSDYMDYTCEVRWNGWCYGLCVADKQLWGLDPITARECEVVGNIYENT